MMKKITYFLTTLFTLNCFLWLPMHAQERVVVDTMNAPSVGGSRPVVVLLPDGYTAETKYPILYLLHGYSGGCLDWTERTGLVDFTSNWPLIIVMPDAGNSWYVNSATDSSHRYEEYLIRDVRFFAEQRYSVDSSKRAIVGLSMGGYGALLLAMRHPDLFRFAGSLSGAIVVPGSLRRPEANPARKALRSSQEAAFGTVTDEVLNHYDLTRLLQTLNPQSAPYLYLVTGIHDAQAEYLRAHRVLAAQLSDLELPYEAHETPGNHSWSFWDREIRSLLLRTREVLKY